MIGAMALPVIEEKRRQGSIESPKVMGKGAGGNGGNVFFAVRVIKEREKGGKQIKELILYMGEGMGGGIEKMVMGSLEVGVGGGGDHPVKGFGFEKGNLMILIGAKGKFPRFGEADAVIVKECQKFPDIVGIPMGVDFDDILACERVRGLKIEKKTFVERVAVLDRHGTINFPVFKWVRKVGKKEADPVREICSRKPKDSYRLGN